MKHVHVVYHIGNNDPGKRYYWYYFTPVIVIRGLEKLSELPNMEQFGNEEAGILTCI